MPAAGQADPMAMENPFGCGIRDCRSTERLGRRLVLTDHIPKRRKARHATGMGRRDADLATIADWPFHCRGSTSSDSRPVRRELTLEPVLAVLLKRHVVLSKTPVQFVDLAGRRVVPACAARHVVTQVDCDQVDPTASVLCDTVNIGPATDPSRVSEAADCVGVSVALPAARPSGLFS